MKYHWIMYLWWFVQNKRCIRIRQRSVQWSTDMYKYNAQEPKNLEGHVLCSNEGTVHWADSRLTLPKYVLRIGLLQYLITWSTKMVRVWKILLAGPERAYYNNWLTCKFSVVCLKRSDCNGCQKWEGFVCQQLLPPSPGWVVFHTNPCTFWTFQTIVNISLSFMAFKLSFFFIKDNLDH